MPKVTLRKTDSPSKYGSRYTPASYDVLVDGSKVARLEGRCSGRNEVCHWHELRDLRGRVVLSSSGVRGRAREELNIAVLALASVAN